MKKRSVITFLTQDCKHSVLLLNFTLVSLKEFPSRLFAFVRRVITCGFFFFLRKGLLTLHEKRRLRSTSSLRLTHKRVAPIMKSLRGVYSQVSKGRYYFHCDLPITTL